MASLECSKSQQDMIKWFRDFKNRRGYKRYGNDGCQPNIVLSKHGGGQRLGSAEAEGAVAPILLCDRHDWMTKQYLDIVKNDMPDLFHLFNELNRRFFNNELAWGRWNVVVFWTKKCKEGPGHSVFIPGAGVAIDLSEPELNGKPMRDIIQTLLHEMIHAWVFFENRKKKRTRRERNDVDHDRRHGAEFMQKMHEINLLSGANVGEFHVTDTTASKFVPKFTWRCNGPCRDRGPYFGWLRRRTNLAPSVVDSWFKDHEKDCGGHFTAGTLPRQHEDLAANFGHKDEDEERAEGNGMAYSTSGHVVEYARKPYTPYVPSSSTGQHGFSVVNVGARKPCLPQTRWTDRDDTNINAFCDHGRPLETFRNLTVRDHGPQQHSSSGSSKGKGYVPFSGKGHSLV